MDKRELSRWAQDRRLVTKSLTLPMPAGTRTLQLAAKVHLCTSRACASNSELMTTMGRMCAEHALPSEWE
jgi:hypothetical protein